MMWGQIALWGQSAMKHTATPQGFYMLAVATCLGSGKIQSHGQTNATWPPRRTSWPALVELIPGEAARVSLHPTRPYLDFHLLGVECASFRPATIACHTPRPQSHR